MPGNVPELQHTIIYTYKQVEVYSEWFQPISTSILFSDYSQGLLWSKVPKAPDMKSQYGCVNPGLMFKSIENTEWAT